MADTQNLTRGRSVTLDGTGAGRVELGPDAPGPANWEVTSLIVRTTRPGLAPIPRVEIFLDTEAAENSLAVYYDGSFGQAIGKQVLSRGSHLIAKWTGGQVGDIATFVVNGEKWN